MNLLEALQTLAKEDIEATIDEKLCEDKETGRDLAEYQKWVDYDMKKYGEISEETQKRVKDAGLEIIKDQYGDYEVIAKEDDGIDESCATNESCLEKKSEEKLNEAWGDYKDNCYEVPEYREYTIIMNRGGYFDGIADKMVDTAMEKNPDKYSVVVVYRIARDEGNFIVKTFDTYQQAKEYAEKVTEDFKNMMGNKKNSFEFLSFFTCRINDEEVHRLEHDYGLEYENYHDGPWGKWVK